MEETNNAFEKKDYLSLYKMFFGTIEKVTDRRTQANKFYILLHSGILMILSIKKVFDEDIYNIPSNLRYIRADDISIGRIDNLLLQHIHNAPFLIVDLTGNNPNVFYEYGLGVGIGKQAILLNQDPKKSSIDVINQIQIKYELANLQVLERNLVKAINICLGV